MQKVPLNKLVIKFESGSRPKGGVVEKGIPSLGGEHISSDGTYDFREIKYIPEEYFNSMKKGIVEKDDILIVKDGATTGKIAFIDESYPFEESAINEHLFKIKVDSNKAIPKYVYYYLFSKQGNQELMKDFRGATVGGISKNFVNFVNVPLPKRKELQIKIVNVLDRSKELIKKRKAQIEALDQLAQSVFLEMFGDPSKNPKNWPVVTIGDITLKTQYGTSKKASETTGKYPILRMGNITYNGLIDFSELKYVDLDDSEAEKYLVHKGELLFNRTNSKDLVGKTAVYREEEPMAYAGYLVKLVPNEKANSEFISAYLNSKYGKAILFSMAKNIVGMANINAEELKSIKIYLPPKDLQDKFASVVSEVLSKKDLLCQGLKMLEDNFNSLLQRAFKGELFTEEKVSSL